MGALKAVIRRKIISWCAYDRKNKQLRLTDLNIELKKLEVQHKRAPASNLLTKTKRIRNEMDLYQEIEKKIKEFAKQKYYDLDRLKFLQGGYKNKKQLIPYTK